VWLLCCESVGGSEGLSVPSITGVAGAYDQHGGLVGGPAISVSIGLDRPLIRRVVGRQV
jgi:hypothetical protein